VFGIFVFPFTGLISIVGGFLAPTHPGLAAWLLFVSGLIGLFLILGVPSGILLVIGAMFALSGRPDNYEADLVQVKNMIADGNYTEAMPRVFKLSRINPDNPEVKLLIQKWRESKNNPDNRV
jgi:hypothetical protein